VATGSESSKWGDPRWVASPRGANWIEQGLRSAGLGLAESHHQEAQPDFGRNDGRDHIHIAPHVTIHGTAEIAPGLIRINAAYGYMRAFDEFSARRSPAPSAAMISEMRRNSREIALLRRRVFRDEELLPVKIESGSTGRTFVRDGDRLRRIRAGKHQIAKLVEARILKFGEESVPLRLEADRPVNTWWTDWEQHDPDLRPVYAFGHFSYSTRIRIEHSGRPKDEAASSFNLIQVDLDPRVVAATSTV
jgi:hypothetical protein